MDLKTSKLRITVSAEGLVLVIAELVAVVLLLLFKR